MRSFVQGVVVIVVIVVLAGGERDGVKMVLIIIYNSCVLLRYGSCGVVWCN